MVRVVVDSNLVGGKSARPLTTKELRRLLDETQRGNLQLVVPEIVVREASNLYANYLKEHADAYRQATSALRQAGFLRDAVSEITVEHSQLRTDTEAWLRDEVTRVGGAVPPLPRLPHDQVLERALRRGQPFDPNGQNGYRDVLLWETVLKLIPDDDPIVLVSRDKAAFFEKDAKTGLARPLAEEAATRFERPDAVKAYFDQAEGLTSALGAAEESAEQERRATIAAERRADERAASVVANLLTEDEGFLKLVGDAVDEALQYMDLGPELSAFGIGVGEIYGASIEVLESLAGWMVLGAHEEADGSILCELAVIVTAVADATMHPSDAVSLEDDPRVRIYDYGFGTPTAGANVDIIARVTVDLVVDTTAAAPRSLATVSNFEPLNRTGNS